MRPILSCPKVVSCPMYARSLLLIWMFSRADVLCMAFLFSWVISVCFVFIRFRRYSNLRLLAFLWHASLKGDVTLWPIKFLAQSGRTCWSRHYCKKITLHFFLCKLSIVPTHALTTWMWLLSKTSWCWADLIHALFEIME